MRIPSKVVLCCAMAFTTMCQAWAWSVNKSNKTNVRVLVVDEDGKPVVGQKVDFRLKSGGGPEFSLTSDKDGMVSFRDDIGSYAVCQLDLDRKTHYPVWFEFHSSDSGSIVTGVVKRVVKPSGMVGLMINRTVSNGVDKVGLDLLYGDLVQPFGNGRHADLYMTIQTRKDESIKTNDEWRRVYSQYGFLQSDLPGGFSVVDQDVGCWLPTPTFARETMLNNTNVVFFVDRRPNAPDDDYIGEKKYVIVKVVRPQGVFYGVIVGGAFLPSTRDSGSICDLMYSLNVHDGDRNIVWKETGYVTASWRDRVKTWYAEEEAEKGKKTAGKNEEAAK